VTIEATKCFYFQYIDNIKNFIKNGFASHPSYAHPHFAGSSIKFLPHLDLAVELSINAALMLIPAQKGSAVVNWGVRRAHA